MDFTKMKSTDIIAYGLQLGVVIDNNVPRAEKIKLLEDRCAELAQ